MPMVAMMIAVGAIEAAIVVAIAIPVTIMADAGGEAVRFRRGGSDGTEAEGCSEEQGEVVFHVG